MKKIYNIKHTLWYQGELTVPEDEQIADVHKYVMDALFDGKTKIGDVVEALYKKQNDESESRIQRVLRVVLKPYEPTILHRWWNKFWLKHYGIKNIYEHIPKSIIVKIITDFFFFDLNWIPHLVDSIVSSVSSLQKITEANNLAGKK